MTAAPRADRACDYCGLPVPAGWWKRDADEAAERPEYCCFGCRLAASVNDQRGPRGAARSMVTRLGLAIFFTMNVTVFTLALWTQDIYGGDIQPDGSRTENMALLLADLYRYLALVLSLPVLILLGGPLAESAWCDLRQRAVTADLLLVLGVGAAYVYSAVSVFSGGGHVYFEVGCIILVMVTLGRWLEATGKLKTTDSLAALQRLLPDTVEVDREGRAYSIRLDDVRAGDRLRILPGQRIPVDGRLLHHSAAIDQQIITGESRPVVKEPGGELLGGSLNLDGQLTIQATTAGGHGTLDRLIAVVHEALRTKGRYQRLADRASAWFVPAILLIALAAFFFHAASGGLDVGLMAGLAVVLIACPCALGIATPLAVWSALGRASRHQVLFRGGETLERLAEVRAVRFDKTGTLTDGVAEVTDCIVPAGERRDDVLHIAAALAATSSHVLSTAIGAYANQGQVDAAQVVDARTIAGRGVVATLTEPNTEALLGNWRFMQERDQQFSKSLARHIEEETSAGNSLALIAWSGRVRGLFLFRERLRAEARASLDDCRRAGLDLAVLTGDHRARGEALSAELGIVVRAELMPEEKLAAVTAAREQFGSVAMVGDGINDAPALAAADVGIAMGCGADVSRDSADVCLLGDDLSRLPWAVDLSRRTVRVIRQNLLWAFAYNSIGVVLAATGRLNPIVAALAMVASNLLVVSNSLRLSGGPFGSLEKNNESAPAVSNPQIELSADSGTLDWTREAGATPVATRSPAEPSATTTTAGEMAR